MTFKTLAISYLLTTLVFFAIDIIWLGAVAKGLYAKYLGGFLAPNVNWAAAIIFYLLGIASRKTATRVVYLDAILYLAGGLVGTAHHWY